MHSEALLRIREHAETGLQVRREFFERHAELVLEAGRHIALVLARGGKILLCGNGGSAADAQHLAAEFVNRYKLNRPPLAAVALSTDTSILTAIGNDFSFEEVFSKQVEALGRPGDLLLGISTSGNSANVVLALEAARRKGLKTLGFSGRGGGRMNGLCDLLITVDTALTPLVQEVHIAVGHLLCELADYYLFENASALEPYLAE